MMALFRDAYNRKLVSTKQMYALALAYEENIAKLNADHAKELRTTRKSAAPTVVPPPAHPNHRGATDATANDGAVGATANNGAVGATANNGAAGPTANGGAAGATGNGGATGAPGNGGATGATANGGAAGATGNGGATANGAAGRAGNSNENDAPGNRPAKRGRPPKSAEGPKEESVKRTKSALNLKIYKLFAAALALLGGHQAALTLFIVGMIRASCTKSGLVKRHVLLSADVISLLLDDVDVCRKITKELDKRRRPPIARFRNARLDGVTVASMDKLRFATIWTPGHSTLSNEIKRWEAHLAKHWCRCSAKPSRGTTRTAAQQAEAAEAEAHLPTDEDQEEEEDVAEAEVDAAMDEDRDGDADATDDRAAQLQEQGLDLLAAEYPDHDATQRLDQWAGGLDEDREFENCNVVHVIACGADGMLLGFIKALVRPREGRAQQG